MSDAAVEGRSRKEEARVDEGANNITSDLIQQTEIINGYGLLSESRTTTYVVAGDFDVVSAVKEDDVGRRIKTRRRGICRLLGMVVTERQGTVKADWPRQTTNGQ